MNVWPETSGSGRPSLATVEGELVSISIGVDPRRLEQLLETLAGLPFPVNPQIYHGAPAAGHPGSGGPGSRPATSVQFPAYAARLSEICSALSGAGFDPASICARSMLEQICATPGRAG